MEEAKMNIANEIMEQMTRQRDEVQANHLMRFFKCGKGEYGEGDRFLGLRVPQTRSIVKEYRKKATVEDSLRLLQSPWHEIRLAGLLLMAECYKRAESNSDQRKIVECYLESLHRVNNWDLVDLSANILGDWLVKWPDERHILYSLSERDGELWHQRVAIVATWMLIRHGDFDDTFKITEKYFSHPHDLIHKASGWMLREIGKRGGHAQLRYFLNHNASSMTRTMLRYAIEKFPEAERQHYLKLK